VANHLVSTFYSHFALNIRSITLATNIQIITANAVQTIANVVSDE
jgi:hypothetical protein